MGNLNQRPVGRCGECGGVVSIPRSIMSTQRPVPTCEACGAVADEAHDLPILPMKKRSALEEIARRKEFRPKMAATRAIDPEEYGRDWRHAFFAPL